MASRLNIGDLTGEELLTLRREVEYRRKNPIIAWALWFLSGPLGGHRFYMGRIGTGIIMFLTLGGLLVWALVDGYLLPKWLRENEWQVEQQVLGEIAVRRETADTT